MLRRRALQVIGTSFTAAGGLLVLSGCNKSGSQGASSGASSGAAAAGAGGSCQDKIEVDETAANLRRTLQYKEKSDTPEKKCSSCAQFEPERYAGTGCGGCKLFAGAVNPEGICLSFAPKGAPPAAAGVSPPPPVPGTVPAKGG
jgi:hypothetical protein